MQRGGKFSLAAALWGWPPAPGHAAPNQHAPDTWLDLFTAEHARTDPAVLSGVFTACRSGRDWVLEVAPRVSVHIDTSAPQPVAGFQRRSSTFHRALSARSNSVQRTQLQITCSETLQSSTVTYVLPSFLSGLSVPVTDITLQGRCPQEEVDAVLSPIAGLLLSLVPSLASHLTTLSLDPCPGPLPPPQLLPQLRSLSVSLYPLTNQPQWPYEQVIVRSIGRLVTQLTALVVNRHNPMGNVPWSALTPDTPSYTLTTLSTNGYCDMALLRVATQWLPALETLRAGQGLTGLHGSDSGARWAVRKLELPGVCNESVFQLPRCAEGVRTALVSERLHVFVQKEAGLWDTQIESLRGLELQVKEIVIEPYSHVLNLPPHQHISTLRNTLRQVGDAVKASGGTTLCLKGWPWTEDLIREYIGAIPALKECGIAGQALHLVGALTDDLLGAVLQAGNSVTRLVVPSLELQSDQHADTPWPWEALRVDKPNITDLCKLPDPAGQRAVRVLCRDVYIDSSVLQDDNLLLQRLQHIEFTLGHEYSDQACVHLLRPKDSAQCAATQAAQLSVLRALRVIRARTQPVVRVRVNTWPSSHRAKSAWGGIPKWGRLCADQASYVKMEPASDSDSHSDSDSGSGVNSESDA